MLAYNFPVFVIWATATPLSISLYKIGRPKKDKKLPVVLSQEEVLRILSSVTNLKHRLILMLIYSAGLRVGEVVKLRVEEYRC